MDLAMKSGAVFNYESARSWFHEHRNIGLQVSTGYILLLFLGRKLMRDRDPMQLNYFLIAWNLVLAVFSILGTINSFPDFTHAFKTLGFRGSYCKAGNYFHGNNGYWAYLFTLSKVLELGDSIFLVLRKRPLIFLHWYHHATVLIYLWMAYPNNVAAMRWGMMLNFVVHSFMYTYYLFRSLRIALPRFVPQAITCLQIIQFLIGVYVTADVTYRSYFQLDCECPFGIAAFQLFLYLSYLILFANFFYDTYLRPGARYKRTD